MLDTGKQMTLSDAVASQLVSHDHPRQILQAFQQPSEEALGGVGIAPVLNKDVEHNAVLIHGTPKVVLHALDPDEHLVEVPLVPWPRPAAAQAIGKALAEFPAPSPHGLIGDNNTSLSQKQLNIAQAEAEHMIQPDSMADDLGGEAMAVVRVGWGLHAASLARSGPAARPSYRDNASLIEPLPGDLLPKRELHLAGALSTGGGGNGALLPGPYPILERIPLVRLPD